MNGEEDINETSVCVPDTRGELGRIGRGKRDVLKELLELGHDRLQSLKPYGELLANFFHRGPQLGHKVGPVGASLHRQAEDGADDKGVVLAQGRFVRLREAHSQFLGRIVQRAAQSSSREFEATVV